MPFFDRVCPASTKRRERVIKAYERLGGSVG